MKMWKIAIEEILTNYEKENPNPMVSDQNAYKQDWLKRHEHYYKKGNNWVFYHGMPKTTFSKYIKNGFLRSGSLLARSIEEAIHYAGRDRDLKIENIVVLELTLQPNEFNAGIFPSIDIDIPISDNRIKRVK